MIGPQHDNGIIRIGTRVKRVEHFTYHRIGKVDRGQITLNGLLPLAFLLNMSKVAIGASPLSFRR